MEETYPIRAIVLGRQAYRENDLLVTLYSVEQGKNSYVARGAKKFRSKLAAHLEPFCLIDGMVVRGRQSDYLGSAVSFECFVNLKADLGRLSAASEGVIFFKNQVKENEPDKELFSLLLDFLAVMNSSQGGLDFLQKSFNFKLINLLGKAPDLYNCSVCGKKLLSGGNKFDRKTSSIVHPACSASQLTISDECVKVLRAIKELSFLNISKVKAKKKIFKEFSEVVELLSQNQ